METTTVKKLIETLSELDENIPVEIEVGRDLSERNRDILDMKLRIIKVYGKI